MNPLLVVIGPTGSGKSGLAIRLALEVGGEIVNCDSLQLYKGLDIGTAKVPEAERSGDRRFVCQVLNNIGLAFLELGNFAEAETRLKDSHQLGVALRDRDAQATALQNLAKLYGNDPSQWTYADFNDPRLNQLPGTLAKTGDYTRCVSPYGLYDCVGNLHEWGSDPADAKGHGRFRGGFYGDAEVNGHGCLYVTSAHELAYHDYSTGFRCCADPGAP